MVKERHVRLHRKSAAERERQAAETDEQRHTRLERVRAAQQERLAAETAQEREARQQHDRDRHSEHSVQTKMLKFHDQIASLSSLQCTTCSEKFPGLRLGRDKHIPKLYSPANNMVFAVCKIIRLEILTLT